MQIVLDRDDDQIGLGRGHDPQAGAACRGAQRLRGLVGGTVIGHRDDGDRGALKLPSASTGTRPSSTHRAWRSRGAVPSS